MGEVINEKILKTSIKNEQEKSCWYAVYTLPRHEKKVLDLLEDKDYNVYLPLIKTLKQYSDRKKLVTEPLLKSYIFVKVNPKEYYDVLNTPSVVRYVCFEGKAAPIPEFQIQAMKAAIENQVDHVVSEKRYQPGEIVQITSGPMIGNKGEIVRTKNGRKKLILRIGELGFVMEIGMEHVD